MKTNPIIARLLIDSFQPIEVNTSHATPRRTKIKTKKATFLYSTF